MTISPSRSVCLFLSFVFLSAASFAANTAGKTLLQTPNARPSALGEAFSAASDDISGFAYNPASLSTLTRSHASFMYQKGLADDSYGQFMLGSPSTTGSLGLSVGYYNGGKITLFDGTTEKTVTAKSDLTLSMGFAQKFGKFSAGISGKYISSQLLETNKATAYAADAGLQMPVGSRLRLGASVQNIGTKLKYVSEANSLPRVARLGAAISLFSANSTILFLEAPYQMNEHELQTGAGLETLVGPLALRAGYRKGSQLSSMTFGAGFMMGGMSLDYSYGLVQDFEASHRVSIGMRFGAKEKV